MSANAGRQLSLQANGPHFRLVNYHTFMNFFICAFIYSYVATFKHTFQHTYNYIFD